MRRLLLLTLLLGVRAAAHADGGHIALHATSGSTTVTLFTNPDPLTPGRADFSLLVQDASTNANLSDARVQGTLMRDHMEVPLAFAPAGGVYAAAPTLPAAGSYTLRLTVLRPQLAATSFSTVLDVQPSQDRRLTVILALLFPLVVIVLFLVNQQLKRNRRHRA